MSTWYIIPSNSDLIHYGILGMKWGVRRYQNVDGTLTDKGRQRYSTSSLKNAYKIDNAGGFLTKSNPKNRQEEYNIERKLAKQTKGYKNLWLTDVSELKKQKEKNDKIIEKIREKRSPEAAGAFLKDLGYEDTPAGREEILKMFNSKELKNMADANQASRLVQIAIVSTVGALSMYNNAMMGLSVANAIKNNTKLIDFGKKVVNDYIPKLTALTNSNQGSTKFGEINDAIKTVGSSADTYKKVKPLIDQAVTASGQHSPSSLFNRIRNSTSSSGLFNRAASITTKKPIEDASKGFSRKVLADAGYDVSTKVPKPTIAEILNESSYNGARRYTSNRF